MEHDWGLILAHIHKQGARMPRLMHKAYVYEYVFNIKINLVIDMSTHNIFVRPSNKSVRPDSNSVHPGNNFVRLVI